MVVLRITGVIATMSLVVACGGPQTGPPPIALDQSVCAHCGMLISEPQYAAAYRAGRQTAVFDDIGCLLRALDQVGEAEVWLLDEAERWIDAGDATFVRAEALETPMGGHMQAFASRTDAESAVARVGGTVIDSFAELRARARAEWAREGGHLEPSH